MRLYSFVNYYLSQLQAGLQTAHCVSEMSVAHNMKSAERSAYTSWAIYDKTIIICNGGNSAMLEDLHLRLVDFAARFELPLTKFYEDEQSLNNALTSVAILVPARFYDVKLINSEVAPTLAYLYVMPDGTELHYEDGSDEFAFISLLKSFRLA